ncbi:MAG: DUF3830 family protein [Acidimicrobiia bacterium]|nr:DUF3830 family protein [Acidimicrobiia bacterium]
MRKLVFELEGIQAIAELHDDTVPDTCDAVWEILPVEGMSIHANWASREIMLHLQGDKILRLPPEGPSSHGIVAPGDIVYFWRAPQMSRGKQLAYSSEFERELSEFAIFYGEPSGLGLAASDPARGADPTLQVTPLFATLTDLPADFMNKCEEIRHKGLKRLVVKRYEE